MKKIMLPVLLALFSFSFVSFAQQIESFDASTTDSLWQVNFETAPSEMTVSDNTTDKVEGDASLYVNAKIGALHEWGSFAQYIYRLPDDAAPLDWSISDSLSIWIKVLKAPAHPEYMVFRIQIADQPTPDDPIEQYIYENLTVLDNVHDWIELKIPLTEIESDGSYIPDSTGFVISPSSWGGFTYNDHKLNLNKIVQFQLGIITSGYTAGVNIPADSLEIAFDNFQRTGVKAIPAILFNGMEFSQNMSAFTWGQSSFEVVTGAGATPNTNAAKWTMGDEWANGWTGVGFNIDPAFNLGGAWDKDSLQFKLKAEDGVDTLRVQFEDGTAKVGYVFKPIADNQWHTYKFALKDFVYQENTTDFNPFNVTVFQIMAEATGVAGKVVYIDDMWTGNPIFDVVPPVAVTGVSATNGTYDNLITWTDVPGEDGELYNIYYSKSPITDITAPGVEVVKTNVAEGVQIVDHLLFAPKNDQDVTYYYAVVAKDASSNIGAVGENSAPITNTAKGVTVINPTAPTGFAADGDLADWAGIAPFRMFPSDGSGTIVTNQKIDGDADLSVNAYVAVDNDYLYVAFDVEDDVVSIDTTQTSYLIDSPDLYIALYNWHGATHTSYKSGDFHLRFGYNAVIVDNFGSARMLEQGDANYYWEKKFPTGYVVEAKIPFSKFAEIGSTELFQPKVGMRIPIDFSVNDNDTENSDAREGILTYSPDNQDQSYGDFSRWLYTWIGDQWTVGVKDQVKNNVYTYDLAQNYPNPFNPTTNIVYNIEKAGMVTLKIYDMLGREVATLINEAQSAGSHTVQFNASKLASGVYMYKINAGAFSSVKKMMLIK